MAAPEKKLAAAEVTVYAETPGFSGLAASSAIAQCPAGYACKSGGVTTGHPDQLVTESRRADDGEGWEGSFIGGPSGWAATVYAECVLAGSGASGKTGKTATEADE